ncbi:MAG: hypothetical protein KDB23_25380, partial [Planctomycetales bacterium]|nr:hypothetical protein [Planctomycetales bacterium]
NGSDVIVTAHSDAHINTVTIAGALTTAIGGGGGGIGVNFAGAGSGSGNSINNTVEALVVGSRVISEHGQVDLLATDNSQINADAGAVAVSLAIAQNNSTSVNATLGASVAVNDVSNIVRAAITSSESGTSSLVTAGGVGPNSGVLVSASSNSKIDALTLGGAVAAGQGTSGGASFAIAGAGSYNTINKFVEATIDNDAGTTVTASEGAINVSALDTSRINADAGGVAIAVGASSSGGTGVGGTIGFSTAINEINNHVLAHIDNTSVTAASGVTISARETAKIDALTLGGAVGVGAGGAAGVGVAGAGAGSGNTVHNEVKAFVVNGSVETTSGDFTAAAQDNSSIIANGGGLGIAVGAGTSGAGVGASLGVAFSENNVSNEVQAFAENASITAAGNVSLSAAEGATIKALSLGGAVAVGAGNGVGVGAAVAGAGSFNNITGSIKAYLDATNPTAVSANGGTVTLSTTDTSIINADAGGFAVAVGAGASGGVGASVGFSTSTNTINTEVLSIIDGVDVSALNGVQLTAHEAADIDVLTLGGAAGVGVGSSAGVGVGVGGAISLNHINNVIQATVQDNSTVTVTQGGLSLNATDESSINNVALGASLAFAGGTAATGVAIGGALSINEIQNAIEAGVQNSTINVMGPVTLIATDSATIDSVAVAATLSVAAGEAGVSFSGGGAVAQNFIGTKTNSVISGSHITSTGLIDSDAISNTSIQAVVTDAAGVGAFGEVGVGVGIGVSVARNFIGYARNNNVPADQSSHDRPTSLTTGTQVKVVDGALAGDVYRYIGTAHHNNEGIDLSVQDYGDTRLWTLINVVPIETGVQAFINDSSIAGTGALTLDAQSTASIISTVVGVATAVSGGGATGVSVGGGGAFAFNRVRNHIKASIDGDGDDGITVASAHLTANDTTKI